MNGTVVETVASSWIEALGGLSQRYMRSVPPCFWASAGPGPSSKTDANTATAVTGLWCTVASLCSSPVTVFSGRCFLVRRVVPQSEAFQSGP